ncbi:MAG: aminotransferase class IV [Proteobacteria bacterium]|nr:aminotransferase class IV [Pseudomonadota bacterium]
MTKLPIYSVEDASKKYLEKLNRERPYKAMYSSLLGGIVTDPRMMIIPIDDHIVHRGDGIFEAFCSHNKAIYDIDAHLDRLEFSAKSIELSLPWSRQTLKDICCEVGSASQIEDITFRLYVSRGPGSFTPNPYDSDGPQLYIVATVFKKYPQALYENGVKVGISSHKAKARPHCQVKSCNYLVNVLMTKETVDRKLNFLVCLDSENYVAEGPTENIALLTKNGEFIAPKFENMLKGTSLLRIMDLAEKNKKQLGITNVRNDNLSAKDFENAAEVFIIGTTMGILPVSEFNSIKLKSNHLDSCAHRLKELLENDFSTNSERRTLFK